MLTAKSSRAKRLLIFCTILVVLGITFPLVFAQSSRGQGSKVISGRSEIKPTATKADPSSQPAGLNQEVQVMVEMQDAPAAVMQAEALKQIRTQVEQERLSALAQPKLASSQAILQNPRKLTLDAAAKARVQSRVQELKQKQQPLLLSLTAKSIDAKVLYRAQRAYNGIAISVNPSNISQIEKLPGVKAVHPLHPKYRSATFSDIDFLRARTVPGGPWTTGNVRGEGIKVADIDTGLDYVHADFGGDADYTGVTDINSNGKFPSAKVPGGTDLVGDAYTGSNTPQPDDNPFDCNGHGTGTASLIAGFGENNDGSTYTGPYNASEPNISSLKISPGLAPEALLYPIRVFGCTGSTNVVVEAIEYAMDNDVDVINMSLGSDVGFADDPDDVAASNAAAAGILVCSAAGNAGDTYYIHSSPAAASGTLSVAATFNDQAGFISNSSVTGNAPAALAGQKFPSIYGNASPHVGAGGLTGDVVYGVPNNASTPFTNASHINGKICLVDRGATTFVDIVTKAFNAGAVAVIVDNFNHPGEDPIVMSTTGQPNIPDVMITKESRDTIVAAAGGFDPSTGEPNTNVNVTLRNQNEVISHGGAAPDTIPAYSSRGPRLPDSAIKPDLAAPAEVVGVAVTGTGTDVENFNGTSSATPHVAGLMALLRQLHPDWSVQELNALACNTATHDLFTTTAGTVQYGVGRIGAGRIDLTNAARANTVAYNGSDADLLGVSFGVVEAPIDRRTTLDKNITVTNKGTTNANYKLSIQDNPATPGARFIFPNGNTVSVSAGTTVTVPIRFAAVGRQLRHTRDPSVSGTQTTIYGAFDRQWLTESAGYAVFTPTDDSPTLRVSLYAAVKPVSSMHASNPKNVSNGSGGTGSFSLALNGHAINTGSNYGNGFDIISLVKPLELQYARSSNATVAPLNSRVIQYAGVTSDYFVNSDKAETTVTFGIETVGSSPLPEYRTSDREILIDTDGDNTFDFVLYPDSLPVGTSTSNVYFPILVNLHTGAGIIPGYRTNLVGPASLDTNSFNNNALLMPLPVAALDDSANGRPAPGSANGPTSFKYLVVTYDRNNNEVDETPILTYDLAHPGFDLSGGNFEPFYYPDVPAETLPVDFFKGNFNRNGSLGVLVVHMHNGNGQRSDVVPFRRAKP